MKFSIIKDSMDKVKADAVVITCFGSNNAKKPKTPIKLRDEDGGKILDKKLSGIISKEIRLSDFKGKICSQTYKDKCSFSIEIPKSNIEKFKN